MFNFFLIRTTLNFKERSNMKERLEMFARASLPINSYVRPRTENLKIFSSFREFFTEKPIVILCGFNCRTNPPKFDLNRLKPFFRKSKFLLLMLTTLNFRSRGELKNGSRHLHEDPRYPISTRSVNWFRPRVRKSRYSGETLQSPIHCCDVTKLPNLFSGEL